MMKFPLCVLALALVACDARDKDPDVVDTEPPVDTDVDVEPPRADVTPVDVDVGEVLSVSCEELSFARWLWTITLIPPEPEGVFTPYERLLPPLVGAFDVRRQCWHVEAWSVPEGTAPTPIAGEPYEVIWDVARDERLNCDRLDAGELLLDVEFAVELPEPPEGHRTLGYTYAWTFDIEPSAWCR